MSSKGSVVRRSDNTGESALKIISELVGYDTTTLQVQREMVHQGLRVDQTTAGEALDRELVEQRRKYEEEVRKIKQEKEQAERDHDVQLRDIKAAMETERIALLSEIQNEQVSLHADRRDERRRLEQQFEDERMRMEREIRELRLEARRGNEEAETNAQEARMKISRLESEVSTLLQSQGSREQLGLKEYEKESLDEKDDLAKSLQKVFEQSDITITLKKLEDRFDRFEERQWYEERQRNETKISEVERQQQHLKTQSEKHMREMEILSNEIREYQAAQQSAKTASEKEELESRIQELEAKKKEKSSHLWTKVGGLAGLTSVLLAAIA